MEWKEIKKNNFVIFPPSLLLFESFNGGNKKFILLFGNLSGREWNGYGGILIPPYSLKFSFPPKLGDFRGNRI